MTQAAILVLEDGTVFEGESVGAPGLSVGEVVFNTAMTGYQEMLTDPSYARQMITLTYPHIGNTGTTEQDNEASQVWAAGLIVRDVPRRPSSWRNQRSLPDWLQQRGVVAIAGIDTRKLTRILRERGAQNGALMAGPGLDVDKALEAARKFPGLKGMDLAKVVSTDKPYAWREGQLDLDQGQFVQAEPKFKVVAYDFGVKTNILRMLAERGCDLTVVPAQTPAAEVCWSDLVPQVQRFWDMVCEDLEPRQRAGRLKQWLNLLRRRFPEAEQAYQEVRTQTDQREITLWVQALARRQEWAGL